MPRKKRGQEGYIGKKPNNYNLYLYLEDFNNLNKIQLAWNERSPSSTVRKLIRNESERMGI